MTAPTKKDDMKLSEDERENEEELEVECLPEQSHLGRAYKNLGSYLGQMDSLIERSMTDQARGPLARDVKILMRRLALSGKHYAEAYEDLNKVMAKTKNPAKTGHMATFERWLKEDPERFLATTKCKIEIAISDLECLQSELGTEISSQTAVPPTDRVVSQEGFSSSRRSHETEAQQQFLLQTAPFLERNHELQEQQPHSNQYAATSSVRNPVTATQPPPSSQELTARLPRLPALPLPEFDGNCLKFSEWFERFEEAVHSRSDLSDSEKMSYLLTCVSGTAKVAVSQFPTTASGYSSAIALLKDSFGAKESDERTLAVEVEMLAAASTSWNDQLCLVLTLKALIARMARIRESVQSDVMMQEIVTRKFPVQLKDKLRRFAYKTERVTVKALLDEAENLIREEIFVATMNDPVNRNSATTPKRFVNTVREHRTEIGFSEEPTARNRQNDCERSKCIYCGKHSLSYDCFTIRLVVDRVNYLKRNGLCIACLKPDSTMHSCDVKCPICEKQHDLSVCTQLASMRQSHKKSEEERRKGKNRQGEHGKITERGERQQETRPRQQEPRPRQQGRHRIMANQLGENKSYLSPRLQTGEVTIRGDAENNSKRVAFLLDTGASISLVSEVLAEKLSLRKLHDVESTICGLGDKTDGRKVYPIYEVPLESVTGKRITIKAMGFPEPIVGTIEYPPLPKIDVDEIRLRKLKMADECDKLSVVKPQLLLGNKDYLTVTRVKEQRIYLPSGHILLPSLLGWIATGGETESNPKVVAHLIDKKTKMKEVTTALQSFLAIEECVKGEESHDSPKELEEADEFFRDHVRVENGRIHAQYCIRTEALEKLSGNLKPSYARLRNMISSLREKGMLEKYNSIIREHMAKKQVEEVKPPDKKDFLYSYLPHHPVYRPDKPQKPIRIVFDASAKERGKLSLNDCMKDCNIRLERIPGLLLRTRCAFSIVLSDVEAAFLQIVVDRSQRDLMRFLWVKDPSKPIHDENVMHLRFQVAPFGISQSPFLLESAIRYHVENTKDVTALDDKGTQFVLSQLRENVYVDNIIFECEKETDKLRVYQDSKKIFAKIGMNLREFSSDSTAFVESLPESDRGKIGLQKILGIQWCSQKDELELKTSVPKVKGPLTKRVVLSKLASTFDPLGLMAPLLLQAKVFVQQLWSKEYGWDTPLTIEDERMWMEIERDMSAFLFTLPRRILQSESKWMLVAFADASCKSMAAAVYIVGQTRANLAMARSQLAPFKLKSTIPRLELRAMLLAAKLLRFVGSSLSKTHRNTGFELHLFTDSMIALYWESGRIKRNEEKGNRSIANTSKKIAEEKIQICRELHGETCKEGRDCIRSNHVCSEENPADLATRGVKSHKLTSNGSLWWYGPEWLNVEGVKGRKPWNTDDIPPSVVEEAAQYDLPQPVLLLNERARYNTILTANRFSSFSRMTRTVVYVKRFIWKKLAKLEEVRKARLTLLIGPEKTEGSITARELYLAEQTIVKIYQQANLEDINTPGNRKLQLFKDEREIYRCGHGRLGNSNLPLDRKCPMFLPGSTDEHLIALIIRAAHVERMHSGENHTLDAVRSRYWLVKCRRVIRKVLKSCTVCRKALAVPFAYPAAPDLPEARVIQHRPFQHVGIDYAGPFSLKNGDERFKAYVLLITCMTTRAIHLEVTKSLSAVAFIAALRRFVSRRGVPEHVTSDNAPTFHCASSLLKENDQEKTKFLSYIASKGIQWSFTTPHAPWKGGVYERLVGMMKGCLVRTIGRKFLDWEEFETVIIEIEAVLNSRPLTSLSNDLKDNNLVIRPCDILMPMGGAMGISNSEDNEMGSDNYVPPQSTELSLRNVYRGTDVLIHRYWKLFKTSYINSLRSRAYSSVKMGRTCSRQPIIGEVVLIEEEVTPRGSWPLGRVLEVNEREATIRTGTGSILRRPLNLLVPLEVFSSGMNEQEVVENEGYNSNPLPPTRPQRSCKSLAKDPAFWEALRL